MYVNEGGGGIIGRDDFLSILSGNGLNLRIRKRTTRATFSDDLFHKYPDLRVP